VDGKLFEVPTEQRPRPSGGRWRVVTRHILSLCCVILLACFLRHTLLNAWEQFHRLQTDAHIRLHLHWGWSVAAAAMYVVGVLPAGWFWHRVLRDLGQETGLIRAMRAYMIGHLGKYVPGKLWVVVLRVGLVSGPGVQPTMAGAAVFVETLTMMAVGALLSALYLIFAWQGHGELLAVAVGIACVAGILTLPPIFKPILRIVARRNSRPEVLNAVERLGFRTLWQGWGGMLILWACFGISLWMTLRVIGLDRLPFWAPLPAMIASAAMATVSGFVIILLPGGLGVREFVLVALLAPYLKGALAGSEFSDHAELMAVLAACLLRIEWLLAEVIAALLLWLCIGQRRDRGAEPPSPEDLRVERVSRESVAQATLPTNSL